MLLVISALLILIYTIICLVKVYKNRKILDNMTGMAIAMILGMVSSLAIGLIIGIIFKGNFATSTIISITFGIIVGVLVGKPINFLATLEGVMGGIMAGMMGARMGDMLATNNVSLLLIFVDVFSIIGFLIIIDLINIELNKHKQNQRLQRHRNYWVGIAAISVAIVFTSGYLETKLPEYNNHQTDDVHHH